MRVLSLRICERKLRRFFLSPAALSGCFLGVTGWLVSTSVLNNGSVTVETAQQDYPMLIGNVISLGLSIIISLTGTYIWPENYSFDETRALHAHTEASEEIDPQPHAEVDEKEKSTVTPNIESEASSLVEARGGETEASITRTFNLARWISIPMFVILLVRSPTSLPSCNVQLISISPDPHSDSPRNCRRRLHHILSRLPSIRDSLFHLDLLYVRFLFTVYIRKLIKLSSQMVRMLSFCTRSGSTEKH